MLPDYFKPQPGYGWFLKRDLDRYYWHVFDTGHGGFESRVEITEESYRYAIEQQPTMDDMGSYLVKFNLGKPLKFERC